MLFPRERDYDQIIQREAGNHAVPPSLIKGVIGQESAFKPGAMGDQGAAFGLMQMTVPTAGDMGYTGDPSGLLEPSTNIHLGAKYLAWLRARYDGTWPDTVSAYNGGFRPQLGFGAVVEPGAEPRCMGRVVPAGEYCNQAHVDKVMKYWRYFETGQLPPGSGAALAGVSGGLAVALGLGLLAAVAVR